MGIINKSDIIAWESGRGTFCDECMQEGKESDFIPMTEADFSDDVVVYCDGCELKSKQNVLLDK